MLAGLVAHYYRKSRSLVMYSHGSKAKLREAMIQMVKVDSQNKRNERVSSLKDDHVTVSLCVCN